MRFKVTTVSQAEQKLADKYSLTIAPNHGNQSRCARILVGKEAELKKLGACADLGQGTLTFNIGRAFVGLRS